MCLTVCTAPLHTTLANVAAKGLLKRNRRHRRIPAPLVADPSSKRWQCISSRETPHSMQQAPSLRSRHCGALEASNLQDCSGLARAWSPDKHCRPRFQLVSCDCGPAAERLWLWRNTVQSIVHADCIRRRSTFSFAPPSLRLSCCRLACIHETSPSIGVASPLL